MREATEQALDLELIVRAYLQAFEERDLDRCLDAFADDAVIHFYVGRYEGKQDIQQWHMDRFAADAQLVSLDAITVKDDTATVEAVATSKRLRAWRIGKLAGRATLIFHAGKIKDANIALARR